MSGNNIFISFFLIAAFLISINCEIKDGYSEIKEEYETFLAAMEQFRNSRDEICKDYDNIDINCDILLASRRELCEHKRIQKDCASIKEETPNATDGVYRIRPRDGKPSFLAYCDMIEQGGGWVVIQRRQDGSEDFYRTWFEYMDGFGNLTGEFWLGNEKIHRLTSQAKYTLRIDLQSPRGDTAYATYSHFQLGDMSEFYKLSIGGYSGTAGNNLSPHNNKRFSAKNLDLDTSNSNCAQTYQGAWWYHSCHASNLNGLHNGSGNVGIRWGALSNSNKATMKIRPVK